MSKLSRKVFSEKKIKNLKLKSRIEKKNSCKSPREQNVAKQIKLGEYLNEKQMCDFINELLIIYIVTFECYYSCRECNPHQKQNADAAAIYRNFSKNHLNIVNFNFFQLLII